MRMNDPQTGGVLIPFPVSPASRPSHSPRADEASAPTPERQPGVPTSRGVETLFRSVYATHLSLDAMADNKSRMMIQIDGLILSVLIAANPVLGASLGPVDPGPAALALVVACTASMLFAVLAARPRHEQRRSAPGADHELPGGLLYFSHFSRLDHDDYVARMSELMHEPPKLYESMSSHLHTLGRLLDREYAWLRLSYGALAIGGVAAGIAQVCR